MALGKWNKLKRYTVFLVGSLQAQRLVLSWVLQKQKVMEQWERLNWFQIKIFNCVFSVAFSPSTQYHKLSFFLTEDVASS
jgi:hypothetical protein